MSNPNPSPSNRFSKGDPRINRKGRPKSFDAFRELAQSIAHEVATNRKVDEEGRDIGTVPITIDGHIATVSEMILRHWAQSKDPRLQMAFIEIAYGKVPQRSELTGADGGPVTLTWADFVKQAQKDGDG